MVTRVEVAGVLRTAPKMVSEGARVVGRVVVAWEHQGQTHRRCRDIIAMDRGRSVANHWGHTALTLHCGDIPWTVWHAAAKVLGDLHPYPGEFATGLLEITAAS